MDLITWANFVNLKDTTPIDEAIDKLGDLRISFKETVDSITKDADRLGSEYSVLSAEAKKMLSDLNALTQAEKQSSEMMMLAAKAAESLAGATKANIDAQSAAKKATNDLAEADVKAAKAKEKLLDGQAIELGSLDALKAKLDLAVKSYHAMGEATDSAVKEAHLKKVEELNNQYKDAKKAIDDAKKSVQNAAGSYNELNARMTAAKAQLKAMGDGIKGNSEEFKKLKKEVADGTKELKKWDAEVGDHQRNVGDYKKALEGLSPEFQLVVSGAEKARGAFTALATNPVGLVILALAAAFGALTAWFTRTETGGDKLAEIMGYLGGILDFLLDQVAMLGGALFEAISEPQKIWDGFVNLVNKVGQALVKVWMDPIPAMKAFGQFLIDQIINRFKGLINIFTSWGDAMMALATGDFGKFKDALKDVGNAFLQVATGVEDVLGKLGNVISAELAAKLKRAAEIGLELARLRDKLEDQEVALIKSTAKAQLEADQQMLKAKDKLRVSDEARYAAIKKVTAITEKQSRDEMAVAQTRLAIAQKEIDLKLLSMKLEEVPLDLIKARTQAEADLINLQDKALNERIRLQKQEILIVKEIETDQLNAAKRIYDAQTNLAKVESEIRAKRLNEIATDVRAEVDLRNDAVKQIAAEQEAQARITADQQLKAAKEAALSRIELDDDTLTQIYNNETLSITQRIELERQLKEQKLVQDKAYVDEITRINAQLVQQAHDLNNAMLEAVKKNIFTQLKDDLDELANDVSAQTSELLIELNDEFAQGHIGIDEYERKRQEIIDGSNKHVLESTLDYLNQKRKLLELDGQDTSEIDKQIADARLKTADATTEELLQYEKDLADAKMAFAMQADQSLGQIADDQFAATQARAQARITELQNQQAIELALAGDNKAAQAEINNKYASEEAKQQQKINDSKRRQAIFDKAKSAFDIGINTGVAVIKAVAALPLTGGLPFSAIVAGIGALQLAAVLAKPIPQFAEGTNFAPGGLSLINEQGPELMYNPSRGFHFAGSDGPSIVDVARGTKIFTAQETSEMMQQPLAMDMLSSMQRDTAALTVLPEEKHDRRLASVFAMGITELERTIRKSNKGQLSKNDIKQAFREALEWGQYLDQNYR